MNIYKAVAATVLLTLGLKNAHAQDARNNGALQVVGLFAQTCLKYPLDKEHVRAWLNQRGVPALTPAAREAFMHGQPGVGFDATTGGTRLALISGDNEACTAIAEHADSNEVISGVQAALARMNAPVTLLRSYDDARDNRLHHNEYITVLAGRRYSLVVSTSAAQGHIQATLTLSPRRSDGAP